MAKLSRLKELNLNKNKFTKVPDVISESQNLERLDLSHNQITSLSEKISKSPKLSNLNLSNNKLREIPEYIVNMDNLRFLDISYNNLQYLPDFTRSKITSLGSAGNNLNSINSLPPNISSINLSFNNFTSFPKVLTQHQHQYIILTDTPIRSVQSEYFSNYKREKAMNIHFSICNLKSLPETICDVNIGWLNVRNNQITTLPKHLGENKYVRILIVSNNPIKELPDNICKDIYSLNISNTEIDSLPKIYNAKELWLSKTHLAEYTYIT